jgi:NAD(P)-dependent dehydrogenase (short-subunit alcohol dehydrogenase family)
VPPVRVAVVTGGSSGIGAALGQALTKRGWRCVLVARGQERLERAAGEIGAEAEVCDVGDRAQVEELATRIGKRHPAVHLLVNNGGMAGRRGFLELEPERIEELVRVHYLGSVWCTLAFLPLLEAGVPAHIVNVASIAGTVAYGASGPYAAAKHAQLAFSRSIGVELAPRGIRVLSVNPGPVETPGFPQERLLRRRLARRLVLGPEQIAERVVRAVESGAPEVFARRAYRLAGIAQALAPSTLARIVRRR